MITTYFVIVNIFELKEPFALTANTLNELPLTPVVIKEVFVTVLINLYGKPALIALYTLNN